MPFSMTLSWPSPEDGLCRQLALPGQSVEGRGFKKKKSLYLEIFFCENKLSLFFQLSVPPPGRMWGVGRGMGTVALFVPSSPLHQCHPDASCPALKLLTP